MNKLLTTMLSAGALAIPFSIHASILNVDDAWRFEDTSAHEISQSSSPSRDVDVSLDDMYRYEAFDAYNINPTRLNSDEIAEFAVFSAEEPEPLPSIFNHYSY